MNRYLNSFFITVFLYGSLAYGLFVVFEDKKIIHKETKPLKTISLNHVQIKKEVVKPKEIVEPKKEIVKPKKVEPKKIVKKEKPKKKIIKKKVVKKKVVKKKIVNKKKIVKKKIEKKIEKKVIKKKIVEQKVVKKVIEEPVLKPVKKEIVQKTVNKEAKQVDIKKDYLSKHLAQVRRHIIKNAKYSKRAKRLRIEDTVKVKFTLLSNGKVKNIQVLSGNKHLHKSAIKAVEKASVSFPKVSKSIDIIIPILYKLI